MLSDLVAWETKPSSERLQMLVVATGSIEANRALGLRSTLVLDASSSIRKQYGLPGTPSAALVDARGNLIRTAIGASEVLDLIGHRAAVKPSSDVSTVEETPNTQEALRPVKEPEQVTIPLPPDAKPIKDDCVSDELLPDGSMVLYNNCQRQLLTLNGTAALIWEYCDGQHELRDIAEEVRGVFPDAHDAERDVREVLERLLEASMIAHAAVASDSATPATPDR
jgi:hypothetical protein